MARTRTHRRSGGGVFAAVLLGSVLVIALMIGWLVWGGPSQLTERASNIDIQMPRAPVLPATPNPAPIPLPTPARPG